MIKLNFFISNDFNYKNQPQLLPDDKIHICLKIGTSHVQKEVMSSQLVYESTAVSCLLLSLIIYPYPALLRPPLRTGGRAERRDIPIELIYLFPTAKF